MAFTLKKRDRRPLFVVVLKDNIGELTEAVVDLTTAGNVFFNMRQADNPFTVVVNRGSAAITDAAGGEVTYTWGTADVATAGDYEAEVEVVWGDGKAETFPNDSYWDITITEDIA